MVWYRDDYDLAAAESWIQQTLETAAAGTGVHFAIIDAKGGLVGVISIEDVNRESGRGMLGYWIATQATGRGLGRRAIEQVVAWAREQSAIATLWAIVADANVASRRVLEVSGFRSAGTRGRDERGDELLIYELELRSSSDA
jgi:RimJ/RimL family protein N-acetyltransferase